ncbi:hypothetical protein NDK47_01670 [Brevibacillus ruminantium]|uniref:Lipoprotein n=1 Tax=Brevibacillus ruminantium TaxID=2950604 RepID=A0ABY4WG05_9BACL|nr:hypothetical protein [Brevibacillus ruminantium]USG66088.1 hypothetical protein NDK47_01670 [Brevibacillus ruminantium]
MKKILGFLFVLLVLSGCSHDDNAEYIKQIENQKIEIENLKKENDETKISLDQSKLQLADYNSRRIMRFISEVDYEGLKKEYKTDFDVNEKKGEILFARAEHSLPLPIKLSKVGNAMFISSFNNHSEGTGISYFIDELETDERHLVTFQYDKDMNFQFIFIGDR